MRVAEMVSLTGRSSFLGVTVSLAANFFTFGAAFSLVLESFKVLRRVRGLMTSLWSALAGGYLL